jgi:hypothetical protein
LLARLHAREQVRPGGNRLTRRLQGLTVEFKATFSRSPRLPAAAVRSKAQRGTVRHIQAVQGGGGCSRRGARGRGPRDGRLRGLGERGLQTGLQRRKGVEYTATARTSPPRLRAMSWTK